MFDTASAGKEAPGGVPAAIDFAWYLRLRWRFPAVCCAAAVLAAGMASLVFPKQYTATASLVIEPPAGMDPRNATALSPVYLESLKTYQSLASSDSLFQKAVEHLGLRERYRGRSVESLKRSMLRVTKSANTRVIDISATLGNQREAQQLAAYIAEQAAALNKAIDEHSAAEAEAEAANVLQRAAERLSAAQNASGDYVSSAEAEDAELLNLTELEYGVDRDAGDARAALAGLGPEEQSDSASERAKIAELDRQSRAIRQQIESKSLDLARAREKRESLDSNLKAARASFESAQMKLDDIKSAAGFRGERLEVLDPGIVPQRPSFPNTPLNILAALAISTTMSLVYLALCFGTERTRFTRFR